MNPRKHQLRLSCSILAAGFTSIKNKNGDIPYNGRPAFVFRALTSDTCKDRTCDIEVDPHPNSVNSRSLMVMTMNGDDDDEDDDG